MKRRRPYGLGQGTPDSRLEELLRMSIERLRRQRQLASKVIAFPKARTRQMEDKLTSDVSTSVPFSAVPKGPYPMRIVECVRDISKPKEDGSGGNPMLVFTFEIDGHENPRYNGKKVPFYRVVIGGRDKQGRPMNIGRLLETIAAAKVPWDHVNCGAQDQTSPPRKDKEKGIYICPSCNDSLSRPGQQVAYSPKSFLTRRVKGMLDVRKAEGSDDEYNDVKSLLPMSD